MRVTYVRTHTPTHKSMCHPQRGHLESNPDYKCGFDIDMRESIDYFDHVELQIGDIHHVG